jgi:hypothetical protein
VAGGGAAGWEEPLPRWATHQPMTIEGQGVRHIAWTDEFEEEAFATATVDATEKAAAKAPGKWKNRANGAPPPPPLYTCHVLVNVVPCLFSNVKFSVGATARASIVLYSYRGTYTIAYSTRSLLRRPNVVREERARGHCARNPQDCKGDPRAIATVF